MASLNCGTQLMALFPVNSYIRGAPQHFSNQLVIVIQILSHILVVNDLRLMGPWNISFQRCDEMSSSTSSVATRAWEVS
jgi:hypothetical protein